jgi:hypothetical protein
MATASLATPTPAKREANVDIESYPCELHDWRYHVYLWRKEDIELILCVDDFGFL